jgi:hypothetical protein
MSARGSQASGRLIELEGLEARQVPSALAASPAALLGRSAEVAILGGNPHDLARFDEVDSNDASVSSHAGAAARHSRGLMSGNTGNDGTAAADNSVGGDPSLGEGAPPSVSEVTVSHSSSSSSSSHGLTTAWSNGGDPSVGEGYPPPMTSHVVSSRHPTSREDAPGSKHSQPPSHKEPSSGGQQVSADQSDVAESEPIEVAVTTVTSDTPVDEVSRPTSRSKLDRGDSLSGVEIGTEVNASAPVAPETVNGAPFNDVKNPPLSQADGPLPLQPSEATRYSLVRDSRLSEAEDEAYLPPVDLDSIANLDGKVMADADWATATVDEIDNGVAIAGLGPQASGLLKGVLAVDVSTLEAGVKQFFNHIETLGWRLTRAQTGIVLSSAALTGAAAAMTLEMMRRQRRQAASAPGVQVWIGSNGRCPFPA